MNDLKKTVVPTDGGSVTLPAPDTAADPAEPTPDPEPTKKGGKKDSKDKE